MSTPEYQRWVDDGRPIQPSRTILEMVHALRAAFPRATFSWHSNDAHYQADNPKDHTPFSYDAWPTKPCPYPYVFATDVMHRPDLGVDCSALVPYWLAEARAGRTPWRKYIIWQATIYDVRYGWKPQTSSGHFDHCHLSDRTDWLDQGIGTWSPTPGDDMTREEFAAHLQYALSQDPEVRSLLRSLVWSYPYTPKESILNAIRRHIDPTAEQLDQLATLLAERIAAQLGDQVPTVTREQIAAGCRDALSAGMFPGIAPGQVTS